MSTQPLPGFRDFYPADLTFRNHIFEAWRRVARRYGFEEFDGPPLEPLELYTAKSGEEIVGQLYSFEDKGGRRVSLRPELTPTVARMIAARAGGMKKPIRWFSIGQMFRYERQQKGRLKEFYQLNCDLIGEPGPLADAEMIALAIDSMREFGLGADAVRVRLSDRRMLTSLLYLAGVTKDQLRDAYAAIDKVERSQRSEQEAQLGRVGINLATAKAIFDTITLRTTAEIESELAARPDSEHVQQARSALSSLRVVEQVLSDMGLGDFVDIDLKIVRGLAYYTGTVFELFDAGRSLRAIAGGGRYDGLLHQLGGVDLPAVGFAIGDVVLGDLLKERGLTPAAASAIDAFVAGVTPEDHAHVLRITHELRNAGVRVEFSLRDEALGKQLKLADARRARFAVVIGPDDRAKGEVQLKDLKLKSQVAVPLALLAGELVSRLRSPTANG
ncbi:MAG: histidine--tRNA ligase [Gemmatimonadota bacterium]|nr:histidine--tRNA ligase [Gemmatimonadota bacterium]